MEKDTKNTTGSDCDKKRLLRFKELQEAEHFKQGDDTNTRVRRTLTVSQFIGGLVVMWILCFFAGKYISGRYWFELEARERAAQHREYNQMDSLNKVEALLEEIERLERKEIESLQEIKKSVESISDK